MVAGLGAYGRVLADPSARAFSFAGLIARLPLSMTGLGIVLLISIVTGSFGRAGLVTAVGTIAGAVAAPAWGRLIDRVGQARVLVTATLINNASLAVLIISVLQDWPLASDTGRCRRGRGGLLVGRRLRAGPVDASAARLGTAQHRVRLGGGGGRGGLHRRPGARRPSWPPRSTPRWVWRPGPSCGLIGSLALAAQRGTEPPVQPTAQRQAAGQRLSAGGAGADHGGLRRARVRCSAAWRS